MKKTQQSASLLDTTSGSGTLSSKSGTAKSAALTPTEKERKAYDSAIRKAFEYHPYGMYAPVTVNGGQWFFGPTFIVPVKLGLSFDRRDFDSVVLNEDPSWQQKATRLLSMRKNHLRSCGLLGKGHSKRKREVTRANGNKVLQGTTTCTARFVTVRDRPVFELAAPLARLVKKVGADAYRVREGTEAGQAPQLFCFTMGKLTGVFALKEIDEHCETV